MTTEKRVPALAAGLLLMVFAVVLIRTAWISDDALITLRTVLNITNGFGLTYNVDERVQTFTHPLWLGLLTLGYIVSRNVYYATFAAGMLCAGAGFWLAVRRAATGMQALVVAIVLLGSRAFVDFSTSGLENPLSYILLALFVVRFLETSRPPARWLTELWLLTSLLYLTRPDDVLLVAPMLLAACWRVRSVRPIVTGAAIGLLPALAWTAFALIYYGFPFPNTAYAKLATGIPPSELRTQGFLYLLDSVDRDPLTLAVISLALLLAVAARSSNGHVVLAARMLGAGLVLHLSYVVSIGGDFMAGRFLAVPLFGAALILGWLVSLPRAMWGAIAAAVVVVGSMAMHMPLWSNSRFDDSASKRSGIVDERGMYFRDRGLVTARRATFSNPNWPDASWRRPPVRVLDACGGMGAAGLEQGPYAYLLDECALADPLLARLPAIFNTDWRSGHYRRMVPQGYRESIETNSSRIEDPKLREYYEHLRLIIRSRPLFSTERLKTIVRMNRGAYDGLIERPFYRHAGSLVSLADVAAPRADGTPWDDAANRVLTKPLAITCDDIPGRRYLQVSLDSDDEYVLQFLEASAVVDTVSLGPVPEYRRRPGLATYTIDVPPGARARGFDKIVITPTKGNDQYAMGHLLVERHTPGIDELLYLHVSRRDHAAVK